MNAQPESATVNQNIHSVAKHSFVYTVAELLKKGVGFFMVPLYTRYLTPADYGLIEVLNLMLDVLGMVVGVRMIAAKTRYYHLYDRVEDKREVYTTSLIFAVCMSCAAVALLWGASGSLARLTLGSSDYSACYHLVIVSFAIQNICLIAENDLIIKKQSAFYSGLCIGLMILSLTLNIVFLSVFHLGAWGILWSILITKIVNTAVLPVTLRGHRIRFSWDKLKKMVRYGLPLVPASLALFAMHYGDRFFLQRFCSLSEVGIYSLGYKFGMIMGVLVTAPFSRAWGTHSFEIAKQPGARTVYSKVLTYFSCLLVTLGLGISIFAEDAIGLLAPPSYAGAAGIIPWIVLAYIFSGLSGFVGLGIMLSFRTKYAAYIDIPIAAFNLILNLLLIRWLGILGAALATLFTFGIKFFVTLVISQRLYPIKFEYRRLLILAAVAFGLFAVSRLWTGPQVMSILFHSVLFLTFPAILFLVKFFTPEEVSGAQKAVQRFLPRLVRAA